MTHETFLNSSPRASTSGTRAYRAAVFEGLDLHQEWLHHYELETNVLYRLLADGTPWREVPISVNYPRAGVPYKRARVGIDWWRFFRPVVLMRLGVKR